MCGGQRVPRVKSLRFQFFDMACIVEKRGFRFVLLAERENETIKFPRVGIELTTVAFINRYSASGPRRLLQSLKLKFSFWQ